MRALAGRRVLLTRPAQQIEALAQAIRTRGAIPVELPLFGIEPQGDAHAHRLVLDRARDFDGWIFTSANAARLAAALDAGPWPALFAIGAATARALAAAGHRLAQMPVRGSDSEALLDLPVMSEPGGKRFLLLTGVGGRGLIDATLRSRGARIERIELYRRAAIDHAEPTVRAALQDLDAAICTSGEGLERLLALTPVDLHGALRALVLVAPSPRVLELARRLGFVSVSAPVQISDEALVQCLERALEQPLKQAPAPAAVPTPGTAHRPP